jgi:hypothetical protein
LAGKKVPALPPVNFCVALPRLASAGFFKRREIAMIGNKPWSEDEIIRLKELRVAGASAGRSCVALKRSITSVRRKAQQLGIPFEAAHELKRQRAEKERKARVEAGLPIEEPRQ